MSRDEAMKQIKDDKISAAVVLPKDFAVDFLEGKLDLKIELIKNPAQQYYPAIVEELLGVMVEEMNAISINFGDDLSVWTGVFKEDELPDFLKMSQIYLDLDKRAKALKGYLSPPLIVYEKETKMTGEDEKEDKPMADVFAFILPGMASMFLLFIAAGSMRDIFKETKFRTFDRFRTMHHKLLTFIASKVIIALILICLSQILLEKLDSAGMNVLSGDKSKDAERGIRIPANFAESVLNKDQSKIEFFKAANSGDQSAAMIEMRLLRAVIGLNSDLIQLASKKGPDGITEENLRELQDQKLPVELDSTFAGRNPIPSGYEQSLPANMVMFIMINLLVFGGASIAQERQSGVIRRLAVHPMTRAQLIMGKVYGRFLPGVFQVVLFMLVGRFIFGVRFGNEPWIIFNTSHYEVLSSGWSGSGGV
jgi:ABC-type multidrug transport system permease subunit